MSIIYNIMAQHNDNEEVKISFVSNIEDAKDMVNRTIISLPVGEGYKVWYEESTSRYEPELGRAI